MWPESWTEEGLKAKRELSMGSFEEREKRREEKWCGHWSPQAPKHGGPLRSLDLELAKLLFLGSPIEIRPGN